MTNTVVKMTISVEKQQKVLQTVKSVLGTILRDRDCVNCEFIWRKR